MIPDIETVQVDCSELTEEQINKMCQVFESKCYKVYYEDTLVVGSSSFLQYDDSLKEVWVKNKVGNKIEITYNQFIEYYGTKVEENSNFEFWFTNSSAGGEIEVIYEKQN